MFRRRYNGLYNTEPFYCFRGGLWCPSVANTTAVDSNTRNALLARSTTEKEAHTDMTTAEIFC